MRRNVAAAVVGALVLAAAVVGGYFLFVHEDTYRITARFTATPGLYPGNTVDILGVPTGKIVSVKPRPGYVDVVMSLPSDVHVPAEAKAVLMAPNPVSDRFVELTPPYTGGDALRPGAVIGTDHTVVPLELDSIYSSVDNLSKALGTAGANAHGDLSRVLHAFAGLADGNGRDLHTTIERIAAALPALTAHPDDLKKLINGLDRLTGSLAARDRTINALYGDLSTATGQLADERQTIAAAVANLQQGLAQVAAFLRADHAHIDASVQHLSTTIAAVMAEQKALIQTFDTAPLGFQNFNRAIDPNSPCLTKDGAPDNCTALWSRIDLPSDAAQFVKRYCGTVPDSLMPIVLHNLGLAAASPTHTACGAQVGLVQNRTGAPGSPLTPDFDLTHYLGTR
jgi:phospholipid/cholesterol/gamma-HCH transport system substrate-binding protein